MIEQNLLIAKEIKRRSETMAIGPLLLSFNTEEWVEYILYLLHASHDPRDTRKNFEMKRTYWFPINHGNDRDGTDTILCSIYYPLRDLMMPEHKTSFSAALAHIMRTYKDDDDLLRAVFTSLTFVVSEYEGNQLGVFSFDVLSEIVENATLSEDTKIRAIAETRSITGINRPPAKKIRDTLLEWRTLFTKQDRLLHAIIVALSHERAYMEAFKTMKFLKKELPNLTNDHFIPRMIRASDGIGKPVTIEFIVQEILPALTTPVRNSLIRALRKSYCKESEYYDWHIKKIFPASDDEIALIKSL